VLGQNCARGLKYSRFCSSYHTFDFDPLSQPVDEALAEITRWARKLSADLILPSDIVSTRLLTALAGRLPVPTCALPDPACFDLLNDKWRFYEFCKAHGVRVPQTWLFDDMDKLKAAVDEGSVPFPFIIKPLGAMGGSGMCQIREKADLKLLDAITYKPFLAQQLITGGDIGINIFANKGRIGAYAIQRNLPDKFAFIRYDQLLDEASRIAAASGFHGLANFDAMREETTGDIYLLECNPRVWMSIFASTVAGINFVKMSLNPDSVNFNNPQCIVDREVSRTSTMKMLGKLVTKSGPHKSADYNLLKYNLADPVGRRCCWQKEFDDAALVPGSPGSIDYQVTALAALREGAARSTLDHNGVTTTVDKPDIVSPDVIINVSASAETTGAYAH
jgi:predicted ATP-grasp superfamily ATP-dependent carboligase